MARANVPLTQVVRGGVTPPAEITGDPVNNHQMVNDGKGLLLVRNSNSGSTARTISFHINGTVDGQAVSNRTVAIPHGESRWCGPFPVANYGRLLLIDVDNAELKLSAIHP